jgi:CelD/BcsL family acetyltransferase involved in cellulose biosynthesis
LTEPASDGLDNSLEVVADPDLLEAEWRELAGLSGDPFTTWEWARTWWRHFGHGDPAVVRLRSGSRTWALLPLYAIRRGPFKLFRFIGHGVADQLGPVCAPADRPAALAALRQLLDEGRVEGDALLADLVPADEGWTAALRGRTLRTEASPLIDIDGRSWEDYLGEQSSNFRSQLGRKERKLLREQGLRYRLSDDPDRLRTDMETLIALHEERWGRESSSFADGRTAFHLDLARAALDGGWLRLWLAESDGRAVAAWYGFRMGGTEWYYQAGRSPQWERTSVGLVLLAHTVREAFNDGLRTYALLRGGEEYKDRFATRKPMLETLLAGRGLKGKAAVLAARAAPRLPGVAKRGLLAAGRGD